MHCAYGVYGAERDRLIARSRLVLNVHYFPTHIFEMIRVSYLLANRTAVVAGAIRSGPPGIGSTAGRDPTVDLPKLLVEVGGSDRVGVAASANSARVRLPATRLFTTRATELLTAEHRRAPGGCSVRL